MLREILSRLKGNKTNKDNSSEFSKFFREASSGEKKRVFMDVAKQASKEQLEIVKNVGLVR